MISCSAVKYRSQEDFELDHSGREDSGQDRLVSVQVPVVPEPALIMQLFERVLGEESDEMC